MKKFAVAAALLSAIVATPSLAAEGGEGRVEVRGGLITGNGIDEGTLGLAVGYDFDLGDTAFVGAEVAGDKVLVDGADVQFSAGGRIGAKLGANGKLFATGGYTFSDIDDPYVGAGYQHKFGSNVYGKVEYRHQFIGNFGDFDSFVAGVGFAF
ncbi:outer membrane protein [Sphingopyxis sp. PET50]|uniref:outer membrane protein n=1 Tax=Sphingopyxis sp. PET50 TaxID=2976533 RepID=UPI0021B03C11|nr:porin family protein [Sphingopyxis sp. PET50]